MKTATLDDLSKQIENLIKEHIFQCRAVAQAAINRAFIDHPVGASALSLGACAPPRGAPAKSRAATTRRTPGELQALEGKLYEQVCANPGATMMALALKLNILSRDLHRPMAALKKSGRVRDVGQRSQTQYFPLNDHVANAV